MFNFSSAERADKMRSLGPNDEPCLIPPDGTIDDVQPAPPRDEIQGAMSQGGVQHERLTDSILLHTARHLGW